MYDEKICDRSPRIVRMPHAGPQPDPVTDFINYKLFNYSSGSEVEAGSFKIEQLLNGNSRLTISISEPFRQTGANFEAVINTKDEGITSWYTLI